MAERIVIVGAALCGGTAAATLRHEGFDGELTLIGSESHPPYERPPLSKAFLRGEVPFEDALVRPEAFWPENGIEARLGVAATGLDTARRRVLTDGEEVPYDLLLIATGARNRRPPIPGLDLDGVLALRTVDEARRIQAEMEPGRRAVICGMGFIGSEVAASLRSRGLDVTAIDSGRAPLERVLGPEVAGVLGAIHRDHGVRIVGEDRVAGFEGGRRVERVLTAGGAALECDFTVVGLGVEPNVQIVQDGEVQIDNGILVDEWCRTNVEGVFAAGDVANHWHPVFGRRMRIEHWQNARLQGRAAALSMLGKGRPYDEIHWFWSEQFEDTLQYAGFHTEWDEIVVRGRLEDRDFTAFYVKDGLVPAAVSLNRPNDVRRAMPMIRSRRPVDLDGLRHDETDLATLA
jgi:3-phenylpropionate/trans-cinnamate dioxygenase ferredoxin reductase subunit